MQSQSGRVDERLLRIAAAAERLWQQSARGEVLVGSPPPVPLNPPLLEESVLAFEREHRVRLPEDFRAFITVVGNGGFGPDYGLLPLERWTAAAVWRDGGIPAPGHLAALFDRSARLPGAIAVGASGSARFTVLVVSGPDRGRLAALDPDAPDPVRLLPDRSYLDWYERWLTEVELGYSMPGFSSSIPGGDAELTAVVEGDDEQWAYDAVRSLARRPERTAAVQQVLVRAVEHSAHARVRVAAVNALADGPAPESEQLLLDCLDHADPRVQEQAARRGSAAAVAGFRDRYLRLTASGDAAVRAAAFNALVTSAPPAQDLVLRALADPSAQVRLTGALQARHGWSDRAALMLLRCLSDPSPPVRAASIGTLLRRHRLTRPDLEPLLADPDAFVRRRAAWAAASLDRRGR